MACESIIWEACRIFLDDCLVQVFHLSHLVLHTVTGTGLYNQRIRRDLLLGDGFELIDLNRIAAVGQSQCQGTVLKIEELTATVGSTYEEIVERLVVLHQIGLYELRRNGGIQLFVVLAGIRYRLVVFQELQILDMGLD